MPIKRHQHRSKVVIAHGRDAAMQIPATMTPEWEAALRYGLERVGYRHHACIPISVPYYAAGWRPDEYFPVPRFSDGTGTVTKPPEPISGEDEERALEFLYRLLRLSDNVLSLLLKDLDEYFQDEKLRNLTDGYVRDACLGKDEVVLVGFSMGSIVGYHLLANEAPSFPVRSFITCGSPMVDPKMYQYVSDLTPDHIAIFPPSLRMWANIWDDDDPATTHHDWTGRFASATGMEVQSERSYGRAPQRTNPAAAHNPFDYFSSKTLAAAVATALSVTDP